MKKIHLSALALGIIAAVGVHTVLFTDVGHRLQSSIIASDVTSRAQIYLVGEGDTVKLISKVQADQLRTLRGVLTYDHSALDIHSPEVTKGTISLTDDGSSQEFVIQFPEDSTVNINDTLATWSVTSLSPEIRIVNLSEVTLVMGDETRALSTEGTGSF